MSGKGILKNTAVVGAMTALSRVLGLVREMFQSRLIGAGVEQSAFVLAFAIPNMMRKLFGEGALTAAFVPVFRGEVEAQRMESARRLARAVMTMSLLMLAAVSALAVVGLSAALHWGVEFSERTSLTLRLTRILVPYMVFICGAAFGMGVLNALGKFAAAASRDDLSSSPLKTGTNAAVSAPSPKSLRIMFGSANARVNALCATPAPIRRDWSISRTSPSTRESAVNAPTVNAFFSMPCPLPLIS